MLSNYYYLQKNKIHFKLNWQKIQVPITFDSIVSMFNSNEFNMIKTINNINLILLSHVTF